MVKDVRELNWEYIAGFFDGEGSVSTFTNRARRSFFGTHVTFSQSGVEGQALLTAVQQFLVERGIKSYLMRRGPKREAHRPAWVLVIAARPSVMAFFEQVRGRLWIKKQIVEDTYRFYTIYPSLRGPTTANRNRESRRSA